MARSSFFGSRSRGRRHYRPSVAEIELNSAPNSDHLKYVLKWNYEMSDYFTGDCHPHLSDNRITQDHLNAMVQELRQSSVYSLNPCNKTTCLYVGIGVAVFIILIILTASLNSVSRTLGSVFGALMGLVFIVGIVFIAIFFCNMSMRYQKRSADLKQRLAAYSGRVFTPLGARAEMSHYGTYITIWFDWKAQQSTMGVAPLMPVAQPGFMPQPQMTMGPMQPAPMAPAPYYMQPGHQPNPMAPAPFTPGMPATYAPPMHNPYAPAQGQVPGKF